jgi:hypothetical protein
MTSNLVLNVTSSLLFSNQLNQLGASGVGTSEHQALQHGEVYRASKMWKRSFIFVGVNILGPFGNERVERTENP